MVLFLLRFFSQQLGSVNKKVNHVRFVSWKRLKSAALSQVFKCQIHRADNVHHLEKVSSLKLWKCRLFAIFFGKLEFRNNFSLLQPCSYRNKSITLSPECNFSCLDFLFLCRYLLDSCFTLSFVIKPIIGYFLFIFDHLHFGFVDSSHA